MARETDHSQACCLEIGREFVYSQVSPMRCMLHFLVNVFQDAAALHVRSVGAIFENRRHQMGDVPGAEGHASNDSRDQPLVLGISTFLFLHLFCNVIHLCVHIRTHIHTYYIHAYMWHQHL